MAIKVKVPNKGYNAFEYGVEFHLGEAVFEDEAVGRSVAKEFGYTVEEIVKEAPVADEEPVKAPKAKKPSAKKVGA